MAAEGSQMAAESVSPLSPAESAREEDLTLEEIEESIGKLQLPPEGAAEQPAEQQNGHMLARALPPAAPQSLEVVSGPPSRSPSPGIKRAGTPSWKISSQAPAAPGDAGTPSSEAGSVQPGGDSFTQQLMAGALRLKSSLFKPERISFADVARNPALAKRARAEMDNHQFRGMIEGQDGAVEGRPHDLEVTRLQVALDVVEADAEEESRINSQLAHLVCLRLDATRKAAERLLGVLQAVTAAEAAYVRAMGAASRVRLVSECDGPSLRAALSRFSDVPWMVGEAHSSTQAGLADVTRRCQEVVAALRKEAAGISGEAARAHAAVLHARKALHAAFLAHRAACRLADDGWLEARRSSRPPARLEADPWVTECAVAQAHRSLHAAQTHQRSMLAGAYARVREHELHRCDVAREVAHAFLHAYRTQLAPVAADVAGVQEAVGAIDCEADLAQFSASAAAAVDTGRELAQRQAAALESAVQDLFASPDVLRQGELSRWAAGTGAWAPSHFVLTRAGFLHWLPCGQEPSPQGSLALARCQFEAGQAPKLHLTEQPGGFWAKGRRLVLQAATVDDSCEWAIALREAIAAHRPR